MVDRLDYFLAKLHENGIYADLNMHVSRTLTLAEGFPQISNGPWWTNSNKFVMYFDPGVQSELKRYCKELLMHRNPYRDNLRRVDDPGIAILETMNEDYFSRQGFSLISTLPELFQKSFIQRWNRWLRSKYGSHNQLAAAWQEKDQEAFKAIIEPSPWEKELGGWTINVPSNKLMRQFGIEFSPTQGNDTTEESSRIGLRGLRLIPSSTTENDYQQQLSYPGISTEKDQLVTLSFWIRSPTDRKIRVEVSSVQGGPWRTLGLNETVDCNSKWRLIRRTFKITESVSKGGFVAFSFGSDTTPFDIAGVELIRGKRSGAIPHQESLDNDTIGVPDATYPAKAIDDIQEFMVYQERAWVNELKQYFKNELEVKVPITGSQLDYHAVGVVEDQLDFADIHEYWHHPIFPDGKEWSAVEWKVGNEPMEAFPDRRQWPTNSLLMRTGSRPDGMPFTVSEWNYPEPGLYSVGCVPMAAMIASLQDWDGVFFFDYEAFNRGPERTSPFFKSHTNNFFSFNGAPAKLTAFTVFANVFRRGDLAPLKNRIVGSLEEPIDGRHALTHRLSARKGGAVDALPTLTSKNTLQTPDRSVVWEFGDRRPELESGRPKGILKIDTPATKGVWGTIAEQRFQAGLMQMEVGKFDGGYGILIASSVDGVDLEKAKQILLLASTRSENAGMKWNQDRTSVGANWGTGPSLIVPWLQA